MTNSKQKLTPAQQAKVDIAERALKQPAAHELVVVEMSPHFLIGGTNPSNHAPTVRFVLVRWAAEVFVHDREAKILEGVDPAEYLPPRGYRVLQRSQ